ncbi:PPM-type phosphatase domain-containing protein, variant 2 [Balamuthia mandrillaris]
MKLRVWDLKAQLRALKQSTTGKKEQLVQRLLACQQADKSENEEEESEKQEQTEEKEEKVKDNEEKSDETKGAEKKVKEGNERMDEDKKDEERMEEEANNYEERRKEQTPEETREKEATEDVAKKLKNAEEQQQEHTNDTQHQLEGKEERETKDETTTSKKEANSYDPNGKDNTPTRKQGVQGRLKKRVSELVLIEDGEEALEGSWLSCDKCDKWIYAPDDNIKDVWIYDDNNPNHEEYYCASCRRGGARAQNEQKKVEEASIEKTVNQEEEVTERHGEASTRKDQLEVPPICLSLSPNVSPKDDTPSVFSSLNVRKKRRRRRSSYSTPRKKSSKTKRCSLSPSKEKEKEIETKGMKEQKQEATKGEEEERKESHENDVAEDMENGADEENEEATIQVLPVSAEVLNKELSFVFMPTKPSAEELRGQQFRFRVGHATCKGGRNENQDAYIVPNKASVKRGDMPVFAVLDGHGIRGKPAAMESASIIASTIVGHYREKKRMSKPKKDQHQQQNSKVERAAAQPSETSGLDDHLSSLANAGQRITRNKAKAAGCSTSAKNTTTINGQTSNEPTSSSSSSSSISSTSSNDPEEELRKCIQESLGAANQRLLQRMERSGEEYGTTCVLAVVMSSRLVLANVGDSRGILFRTRKVGRSMSQQLVLASTDHRPADANERQRIEGCGGRVKPSRVVGYRVYPKEGDFTVEEASQKQLGLAMSRSLGHLILSRYGVSPEPEFFTADLEDGDRLVLACDGIWDVLSTEDVMHLVNLYAGQDPQQACRALVTEAERRWKKKGSRADNMTAVIVFFNRCV